MPILRVTEAITARAGLLKSNEKAETKTDRTLPARPEYNCWVCGATDWWLRDKGWGKPEWLCGSCHPNPSDDNVAVQMPEVQLQVHRRRTKGTI